MLEQITNISDMEAGNVDSINSRFEKINKNFADVGAYTEATYSELKALKDSNQLKTGTKYLLTDYVTKYRQPQRNKMKVGKYDLDTATPEQIAEETEPLLLTAISNNEFAIECYSPMFPDDVVYYDFDNNICEDKTTPRNGFITRRYDGVNKNDAPLDWRHMVWARWKPHATQYKSQNVVKDYEVWTSGNAKLNTIYKADNKLYMASNTNVPSSPTDRNVFFIIYDNLDYGLLIRDETDVYNRVKLLKGELIEYHTFGDNCSGNRIYGMGYPQTPYDTVFIKNCHWNTLEGGCYRNSFGENCSRNTILAGCNYNILGFQGSENFFGPYSRDNYMGHYNEHNMLFPRTEGIVLGESNRCNSFQNESTNNYLGYSNSQNSFINSASYNTLGANKKELFFKNVSFCDISNISELEIQSTHRQSITLETMSNDKSCYWYKTGTNPTDVVTVQIP